MLLLLVRAPAANAGKISFTIQSTVTTGPGTRVRVHVTNSGNEAAFAITPTAVLAGRSTSGETLSRLAPGKTYDWTITLNKQAPPPGVHVLLVRIAYEDANAYPFEALATTPFTVGATARAPVRGHFNLPVLRPHASAQGALLLEVPPGRANRYVVDVVVPRGLDLSRRSQTVKVGRSRKLRIPLEIHNRKLLPGTIIRLYALLRSPDEEPEQTDAIEGVVRVVAPTSRMQTFSFVELLTALIILLLVLEGVTGLQHREDFSGLDLHANRPFRLLEVLLAGGTCAFLLFHYPWQSLLAPTITAGGDMASLFYPTLLMAHEILPLGQLTGWTMGNYAGFPVFHFYSTLPFAVVACLGKLFPMEQTFKLVTLAGPTFLPLAAAYLFRSLRYERGAPVLAATSVLPFLVQQGNSMWGGNLPSVLAGEFCHAIGLTLSLIFLGVLQRTVEGRRSWPMAAILLAAIGLTHTFAFLAALWYSAFFLWPRRHTSRWAPPLVPIYLTTLLLLSLWALPIPSRLVFTTEWSMIWRIKDWQEVLPAALWPAAVLAGLNVIAMVLRVKAFRAEREGVLLFVFTGALLLYLLAPAVGFPDIRFIPVAQLFLGFIAADLVAWLGAHLRYRLLFASCILVAGIGWSQQNLGYIPSWLEWNYSGYQGKVTWPQFKKINDHLRGDLDSPRVAFEHSQAHNRFGSSRAFENLPLFAGRATLEGVFHQASINSPFIFYLQSELSERGSGPFPQYTYTRLNPDKALAHLRLYNVSDVVAVSDKARAAYDAHPDFERTFHSGAYSVYRVHGGATGYVVAATEQPVLYNGPDWKLAFYRWYKHPELLDIPLVPDQLLDRAEARRFTLRTDSITRIPRVEVTGDCKVTSHLEQLRISFDTSCPGRPHIIKVSYFPRWKAVDGSSVLPVSPGFMLVTPQGTHVELRYERTAVDWLGLMLSALGLILLLACGLRPATTTTLLVSLSAPFLPLFRFFERHSRTLSVLLLATAVAGGIATRIALRAPAKLYTQAQAAYRNRDFQNAIPRLEAWVSRDRDTFKEATALFQLGVSYAEVGDYAAAIRVHERLRFDFPNVSYGAGTLYHLASNYARLEEVSQARKYAIELERSAPDSSWAKRLNREQPWLLSPTDGYQAPALQRFPGS